MVVGISQIELHLPTCRSLKDKRQIIKSILNKTQAHCNVSIAEVDHHDLWQRASIGLSCVSKTGYQARSLLHRIAQEIRAVDQVVFLDEHLSVISMADLRD